MDGFVIFMGVVAAMTVAFQARNVWVYRVRMKCLHESTWDGRSHNPYDHLPSYDTMMRRFWVWNINKFLD